MLGLMPGVEDAEGFEGGGLGFRASFEGLGGVKREGGVGQVRVVGRTAYVPQAPFLMGMSVRENILFGRVWEEGRYLECVAASCLEQDFEALPGGDLTELGEAGGGGHHSGGTLQSSKVYVAV
jgi:ABC-type transport system involved in cytochrome bd biosynthesis fused ATPase/permease subunit